MDLTAQLEALAQRLVEGAVAAATPSDGLPAGMPDVALDGVRALSLVLAELRNLGGAGGEAGESDLDRELRALVARLGRQVP